MIVVEYKPRKNPIVEFLEIAIKTPITLGLNSALLILLAFILIRPLHDGLEGAYNAVNFLTRVRAWIPSISMVLPSVKTEIKQTAYKGLSKDQSANVKAIIQTGKAMSMSDRDIKLALMTASQESTLKNLNYGDNWYFAKTGGGISDSKGLFQQRDSWGSKSCRLNPECSSKLFYSALKQVPNRHAMPEWEAIATVQRPAKEYEQEYQKWLPDAEAYLKQTGSLKVSESVKLPTLKSIDVLNWLGTRKDKESPIVEGREGKYVLMTATTRKTAAGSQIYRVSKVKDRQVLESKDAISGVIGSTDRNNKQAGSGQPLPIGEYQIGTPERGNFQPAIGSLWMDLKPLTDVGNRDFFGIHTDGAGEGSAGCLTFFNDKDTEDLAQWQTDGYNTLIVRK